MEAKYRSSKSQSKNQTVPIRVDDKRLNWLTKGTLKARLGAEIDYVGFDNKGILAGGSVTFSATPSIPDAPTPVISPAVNNTVPTVYPGGSGPFVIVLTDPTNVAASWVGDNLNVSFNWDASNSANVTASQFILKLTSASGVVAQTPFNTFSPISSYNTGGTSYTLTVTKDLITAMFNIYTTGITSVCVMVADPFNNLNLSGMVCTTSVGAHVFAVNPPKIQLSAINNGYTVSYGESSGTPAGSTTNKPGTAYGVFPTDATAVDIWELEGGSSPTPTVAVDNNGIPTGWSRVYLGTLDPVNIISPTLNGRWVIARFNSASGEITSFCNPSYIIPTAPVTVNTKVPTSVSSVTGAWSTNDIIINYTLPGATASITNVSGNGSLITYTANNTFASGNVVTITGVNPTAYNITGIIVSATNTQFTVQGTITSTYVSGGSASSTNNSGTRFLAILNAPTGAKGYFYITPDGTANLNQTATIKKADLFAQFGAYYSSFTGNLFKSISITSIEDAGISFNIAARTTSLTSYTPNPTVVGTLGGYTVTFDFSSTPATYGEVYQKYTSAAWPAHPDDNVTMTWVSGGTKGTNTMVVTNVVNEHGTTVTNFPEGYLISGTNVSPNTFISAVSGTGPNYTITLSTYDSTNTNVIASNFTDNATGNYVAQGLFYAGNSPANVFSNFYVPTHVIVQYYDDFGNSSLTSPDQTVTPINASLSIINNAIPIGSGGAIYVGNSATTGARIVLGPSQKAPDGSQYSGIFAFDGSATSGTAATTSIISNPGTGGYTFETVNAKIADWGISTNKIESLIIPGVITKYTGLSASNPNYAFWAGATTASNSDNSAPFSVTPTGTVNASNLVISGGQIDLGASAPNGFHVSTSGALTTTGANVSGNLNVTGASTFTGNILIKTPGSLYSPVVPGTIPGPSIAGTIFNSQGISAYNSSGGYATLLTNPLTDGSTFSTTAANIGGWQVNTSQIRKTGSGGKGNVVLDSSGGYIYITDTNVPTFTAGINSVTSLGGITSGVAFWAGSALDSNKNPYPDKQQSVPNSSPYVNNFVVDSQGYLYATGGSFYGGSVFSSGNLGTVTIDGNKDLISLTSGSNTAYIIPRNNNLYITAPSSTSPFSLGTTIPTSGPTNAPYFSAGTNFKDSWGNPTAGIGIYTGAWDYFSGGATTPFIGLSQSGVIQLSASADIGMLVEKGGAANDAFSVPSILFYTAKNPTNNRPSSGTNAYGAWALFQNNNISLNASNNASISLTSSGISIGITLANPYTYTISGKTYSDPAQQYITMGTTGIKYSVPRFYGPLTNTLAAAGSIGAINEGGSASAVNNDGFIRMLIRDPSAAQSPTTAEFVSGPAIYYYTGSSNPSPTTGYTGDIWIQF